MLSAIGNMARTSLQYLFGFALFLSVVIHAPHVRAEVVSAAGTQVWGDPSRQMVCWRGNAAVDHLGDFDSRAWKRPLSQSASSGCTTLTGSGRFNLYTNQGRSAFMVNREGTDGLGIGVNVCRSCDHPNGCALKLTANPATDASCLVNVPYQGPRQTSDATVAAPPEQARAVWAMGDQPIAAVTTVPSAQVQVPAASGNCVVRPGETVNITGCTSVTYLSPNQKQEAVAKKPAAPAAAKPAATKASTGDCVAGQPVVVNGQVFQCIPRLLAHVAEAPKAVDATKPASAAPLQPVDAKK